MKVLIQELKLISKSISRILRRDELLLVLAIFFFLIFSWPFMAIKNMSEPKVIIIYLFSVWGVLITLLYFISRAREKSYKEEEDD